jgi:MGT family glycosyltransferase
LSSKFLFVLWDGGGNVSPTVAIGRRLAERGHAVRFLASPRLRSLIETTGCAFRPFERSRSLDPLEGSIENQMDRFVRFLCGAEVALDLSSELDREKADVLIVDCMLLGALCGAERSGIPTATLVHLLYQPSIEGIRAERYEAFRSPVNDTRARIGVPALGADSLLLDQLWGRTAHVLIVTPEEFDRPVSTQRPNTTYVGPVFEPAPPWEWDLPWSPDDPDPLVLVSFSSTYMSQEDALKRTAQAVDDLHVRCLMTTGPTIARELVVAPSDVVVREWIPHTAVLPYTSLVVTHAGHSTVMAALAHGIPMVCMPMGRDQFESAERVDSCGAGRTIGADSSEIEIREAVRDVLSSDRYRMAARSMADIIAGYGNGARALEALERLVSG